MQLMQLLLCRRRKNAYDGTTDFRRSTLTLLEGMVDAGPRLAARNAARGSIVTKVEAGWRAE